MTGRPGFVLLYALLVVLTAAALTGGMLVLAGRESLIARRYLEIARARALAEGEARIAFASWSARTFADLPPGHDRVISPSTSHTSVTIRRLDATLFAIVTSATIPVGSGPPVIARAGLLARTLPPVPPESVEAPVSGAAHVNVEGGHVSGRDLCLTAPPGPGITAPAVVLRDAHVTGDPPVVQGAPSVIPPGSGLDPATLARLADVRLVDAVVTPRPRVSAGSCEAGPSSWGTVQGGHPCTGLQPIIHASGDLLVRGGEGRGILVVEGDLVLEGSFQFSGVVLVGGELRIGPGVRISGSVRGDVVRISDAEVLRDACAVADALAAPALDRAYRPGDRWWIPVH